MLATSTGENSESRQQYPTHFSRTRPGLHPFLSGFFYMSQVPPFGLTTEEWNQLTAKQRVEFQMKHHELRDVKCTILLLGILGKHASVLLAKSGSHCFLSTVALVAVSFAVLLLQFSDSFDKLISAVARNQEVYTAFLKAFD